MKLHIASTAFTLPETSKTVEDILQDERNRVEDIFKSWPPEKEQEVLNELGIKRVRVCKSGEPYGLALDAALQAAKEAKVDPKDLDMIIDFSTFPSREPRFFSLGQRLSKDLEADQALNISFKIGGCAGLHLAFKTAASYMNLDDTLQRILLVAADSPPSGSRTLLPITIQGDVGIAVVLTRGGEGPKLVETAICTLGYLYDVITIQYVDRNRSGIFINVDTEKIERDLKPIYYLNFHRLTNKILEKADLSLSQIDHFIYSNLSRTDQRGFVKAFGLPEEKVFMENLYELGHTFSGDLIINYKELCHRGKILPDQWLLFASAGIGFTWGVSLVRT